MVKAQSRAPVATATAAVWRVSVVAVAGVRRQMRRCKMVGRRWACTYRELVIWSNLGRAIWSAYDGG